MVLALLGRTGARGAAALAAARGAGRPARPARGGRARAGGRHGLHRLLRLEVLVLADELLGSERLDRSGRRLDGRELAPCRSLLAHRRLRALLPAARGLLARVARLIELDELVFADRDLGHGLLALEHRIGDAGGIQLDGA